MFLILILILLLLIQDPECQWKPIMAKVDQDALVLQSKQKRITHKKFYDWLQIRIAQARTEHDSCPVTEHQEPMVIQGCDPFDDTCRYILTPTTKAFITPRSWYWQMRAQAKSLSVGN